MDVPIRMQYDISGQILGGWKVISYAGPSHNRSTWNCECIKCGNQQIYTKVRLLSLKTVCPCVKLAELRAKSHYDYDTYNEYLIAKMYSDIPSYHAEVNHALDLYSVDELIEAYTTDRIPELVDTMKGHLSAAARHSSRRKIKIFCVFLQKTDPKYIPSES